MALSTTLLRSVRSNLTRSFSIGTLSNPTLTATTNTVYRKPTTPYEFASSQRNDDVLIRNNPFRLPTGPLECTETKDGLYVRIDMPGIGERDFNWRVKGNLKNEISSDNFPVIKYLASA